MIKTDKFDKFEKGQVFEVLNGNWGGVICEDDKDGSFFMIYAGNGVKKLDEYSNIDDIFKNDKGEIDNIIDKNYIKDYRYESEIKRNPEIYIEYNEGEFVTDGTNLYLVHEDCFGVSVDELYLKNVILCLKGFEGRLHYKRQHLIRKIESDISMRVLDDYLKKNSRKQFLVKALLDNNKDLQDKLENYRLRTCNDDDLYKHIKKYIGGKKDRDYDYKEKGVYIRGKTSFRNVQTKYMYVIDKNKVKLIKNEVSRGNEDGKGRTDIECSKEDVIKGLRLMSENVSGINYYESLESLSEMKFFEESSL